MSVQCFDCSNAPSMVKALMHVYEDGDPYKMMEILTETFKDENLSYEDRNELARLMQLVIAISRQREEDKAETIKNLKIPS